LILPLPPAISRAGRMRANGGRLDADWRANPLIILVPIGAQTGGKTGGKIGGKPGR